MSISNGLITLADYEAFTSQAVVPQNTRGVEQAIETASQWAQRYTGRDFYDTVTASARYFEVWGDAALAVDDFSTVTGLVVNFDNDDDAIYETAWTSYRALPLGGRHPFLGAVAFTHLWFTAPVYLPESSPGIVEVTARWGWTAVPSDVKRAVATLALDIAKDPSAAFGAVTGDFGVLRIKSNPRTADLLDPYIRWERKAGIA